MPMLPLKAYLGMLAATFGLAAGACTVGGGGGGGGEQPPDDEPVIGASAGGETNVISDGWIVEPVHGGNNLKLISFAQMQAEVLRATGVNYAKWDKNRAVFGAVDFKSSFVEDRIPTATKLLSWRKIAFSVCADMVKNETTAPKLFSSIAPTAAIAADDAKVVAQVKAIFAKFFFEPPNAQELEISLKALVDTLAAPGGTPSDAWTNLCVGYLSSMRFLTY